jgi:hypothetical protein
MVALPELRGIGISIDMNNPGIERCIDDAYGKRRITRRQLGRLLKYTAKERAECKAYQIPAYNESPAVRKKRLREQNAEHQKTVRNRLASRFCFRCHARSM